MLLVATFFKFLILISSKRYLEFNDFSEFKKIDKYSSHVMTESKTHRSLLFILLKNDKHSVSHNI